MNNEQNNNITKEKNKKLEKKIKLEIILVIMIIILIPIISNYINTPSNCQPGFDCLGEAFSLKSLLFLLLMNILYISIPLAIINSFIIQKIRKKSLLIPCIPIIIILIGYLFIIEPKPENNLYNIINNTSNYMGEKELDYFIHNDNIYYYKQSTPPFILTLSSHNLFSHNFININKLFDKKVLFKADLNGKNSKKICTLNGSFEYNFIYKNEVFFTTREEGSHFDYHNVLKRLNLDTCEEKIIINNDEKTAGEWSYILNSIKKNEIVFYDYNWDNESKQLDVLYKYNLDDHKITQRKTVEDFISNYIDYNNFDEYKEKPDDEYGYKNIYLNNKFIIKGEKLKIISYDEKNIYLQDDNNIYTLEKETNEIINTQKIENNITARRNNLYQTYFLINNNLYIYNTNAQKYKLILKNINEEEFLPEIYNINNNYLFIDNFTFKNGTYTYNYSSKEKPVPVLIIYNKNSKKIAEEYDNGNLIKYRIDNDKIYLIYKNNTIKKIDLK